MNLIKLLFIAIISFGLLMACNEKKAKVNAAQAEKAALEIKEKAAAKQAEIRVAKERVEDSLRKVDSLQQVKEHGHVH